MFDIKLPLFSTVLVILMFACFEQEHTFASDKNYPPYLRLPVEGLILTIDPGLTQDIASIELTEQLFLGLTDFDPETYEPVPELAARWTASEDGKIYRFHMREDVTWTSGDPVTAHDVVWAIRRNIRPAMNTPYASSMYILKNAQAINSGKIRDVSEIGVSAADDFTVEFTLEHSAAYFPAMAGLWVFRPLPAHTVEKYGDRWTEPQHIQTNGSYMLSNWKKGNVMILKKNPDYYDAENVLIPEVRYNVVPESSAGLLMYENNELDIIGGIYLRIPLSEIPRIKSNPVLRGEYVNEPLFCTYAYGFNTRRPPVDNILVRKAICAAIDRQTLIDAIGEGNEEPAATFTRPPVFGAVSPIEDVGIKFNPDQAKKWLDQAGYPDAEGFPEITLMYNMSDTNAKISQAVQALLKHYLNINVRIQGLEFGAFIDSVTSSDSPHIFKMSWCADYPDANNFFNEFLHPHNSPNWIGWDNPEFAELMVSAQGEADQGKRKAFYKRAEQILTEDECAIIPVYFETAQYLVKSRLKRWYHMAMGGQHIRNWDFYKDVLPLQTSLAKEAESETKSSKSTERKHLMFESLLTKTYYGNTIWRWGLTLVLIALSIILGKILYWVSSNILKKLTEKTETKLDDILVDMTEEPLVFAGVLIAIWYSFRMLTLPPLVTLWIGKIFYILVIFDIAWFISRTVDALVEHYIMPLAEKTETDLDDVLLPLARNLFRFVVWSCAIVIALNNAGYDVGAIIAGLGIGGFAIAMAAKDLLTNIFGGASIMMGRPFSVGQRIQVAGVNGWVDSIGLRVSVIKNFYGRKVIVPNKIFTDSIIENIDTQPAYTELLKLHLLYDTSPEKMQQALDILKDIAVKNEIIEDTSYISFIDFGEYSLDIEMWYMIKKWKPEDKEKIGDEYHKIILAKTQLHLEVLRRFAESGIKLALPLRIQMNNPEPGGSPSVSDV
ncbi:MAG: mechanosensitive ion channel [Desulfobacteraceae bacterium]|nr:mechanosensitive ion channel [Desulfobacteraceae bacterium]